ncbi:P-loop containing nucleoside triphosphate hydrolase protein [Halteromyces radiatus]|uniref:P-loop containing nucleoside triphosphate hydrolase protein n=1 Tax=Halteromyces radiatus TaxID=101107 RepID=UPI00221E6208|nr:P-loop containing nucleoside triphosphate hydrolase protein [Halteromyces radiatus]KAI8097261.1 P-loop containing nucleoside triphosphate hydrolase protein [Halteromyces radiatus]
MGKYDNDFIMTIDDDDETIVVPEEEKETFSDDEQTKKKTNNKKKGQQQDQDFDNRFTFALDGGGEMGPAKPWDFTAARDMLKNKNLERTSIDDIISKKRKQVKEMKKKEQMKQDDNQQDDDNDEENLVDDNDDDLAADGFGAGVEEEEEEGQTMDDDEEEEGSSATDTEDEDQDDANMNNSDEEEEQENEEDRKRKEAYFAPEEENVPKEHQSFSSMNLSRPILKGLANLGFVKPTDIQARTIPVALLGKDICGGAVTGSGKTAAFIVPILERLLYRPRQQASTRVLILCPTRELAAQVHSVAVKLAGYTDITFSLCVGGLSVKQQEADLKLKPDVVVATPGRLIDHIRNSMGFGLDTCEILVMDEADRMLEDGFADELGEIIKSCPKSRQTMLFSATMTDNVDQLVRMSLKNPVRLFVDKSNQAASRLIQEFVRIRANRESDRSAILLALCRKTFKKKVIIFFRSKAAAHQMKILFGLVGLNAGELHGNLTQEQRLESLERFRDLEIDYLLATDLAARGLDIKGIDTVINYNMPTQFAQYLHRVGRTARAGRNGRSVTLVGEQDRKMLKMAIKSANSNQVKNRVVAADTIQKYKAKVESLSTQIQEVLQEEKEERALRQAEMEIRKSENLLAHGKEIYARPARTWFQTEAEKKKSQEENTPLEYRSTKKEEVKNEKEKIKRGKYDGMSRQKRRRRQAMEEDEDYIKDAKNQKSAAKKAKKAAKPRRL